MKRWLCSLALLSLIVIVGCKDESNPTGPNNNTHNGTITATLSGDYSVAFNCSAAYAVVSAGDEGQGIPGSIDIQGSVTVGSDTYMISIHISANTSTGTWDLVFATENWGSIAKNNTLNFSKSGSISITQASSSKLQGTFNFAAFRMEQSNGSVVERTVNVASGTFNVPIIVAQ
jgi:hypothetical protein